MKLEIQDYIRKNGVSSFITEELGIEVKRHPDYPELHQFSYSQINSPRSHPIVQEARGLILNANSNWDVVAWPFKRFANYGEEWAAEIDWKSARFQEKLDGSLIIVYEHTKWPNGHWIAATRSSPSASGNVGDNPITFRQLFWKVFHQKYNILDTKKYPYCPLWRGYTYMFELMTPLNRVVVDHKKEDVKLIGLRNNKTGKEVPVSEVEHLWNVVQEFSFTNINEAIEASKCLNPLETEGYVIVDKHFNRVKVKSPKYVLLHHLTSGFGSRRIIDIIKAGEDSELFSYYPDYKAQYEDIIEKLDTVSANTEKYYQTIRHIENQKDFALEAVKYKYSSILFGLRKGIFKSAKEGFLKMPTKRLEEILCL